MKKFEDFIVTNEHIIGRYIEFNKKEEDEFYDKNNLLKYEDASKNLLNYIKTSYDIISELKAFIETMNISDIDSLMKQGNQINHILNRANSLKKRLDIIISIASKLDKEKIFEKLQKNYDDAKNSDETIKWFFGK